MIGKLSLAAAATALACGGITGCAGDAWSPIKWQQTLAGTTAKPAELQALAPNERIKKLQRLADDADGMSRERQEQVSAELARQIQNEEDPRIRGEIIRALANYDTETAEAVLRAGLQDAEADVRSVCCDAWGERGGHAAVTALGGVLSGDTHIDVRIAAARALGKIDGTESATALAPALEDADPALQYVAVQSLRSISARDLGNDVNAWRRYLKGDELIERQDESWASRMLNWRR